MKKLSLWNMLLFLLTIFYVYFLFSQILFKYISPVELFSNNRYFSRSINLIPFNDLFNGIVNRLDLTGNIILFFPFGILYNVKRKKSYFNNFIVFLISSFSFEILQYILGIGASDITDIILNVLGGLLGVVFYNIFTKILKKETADKIIIVLAVILMLFVISILLLLKLYN